jgi:nucleoside-diphosphate-sugar epimerase
MVVLITGITGFIGSHVARLLVHEGHRVVGFESMPTWARVSDIADQLTIVQGDICDLDVLASAMKHHRITHVIHLAYYLPEAQIAEAPTKAIRVNCEGTNNVFEAARILEIRKVVYSSTDAVCPLGPNENDPTNPTTLYGHMKYFNEVMGRHFSSHFGLDTIGLRFGVNYGPGGRRLAGEVKRKYGSALLHHILEGMMLGKTIHVDMHPQTTFAWNYVRDNARCILLALGAPRTKRRVFDVPGERRPIKDMTDVLERLVPGSKAIYECDEKDSGLIVLKPIFDVEPEIIRTEIGYEPHYTIEAGLAEQLQEVQRERELYEFA